MSLVLFQQDTISCYRLVLQHSGLVSLHSALNIRAATVLKTAHSAVGNNGQELTPKEKVKNRISTASALAAFSSGDFLSSVWFSHLVNT